MDGLYASDLRRAQETARILGRHLGLEPALEPSFREVDLGRWAGLDLREIEARFPGLIEQRFRDPESFRPPGGESLGDAAERVLKRLGQLEDAHRGGSFAVVAHGGVNRIILAQALGLSLGGIVSLEQDFGCLNVVDSFSDGHRVVRLMNGGGRSPGLHLTPGEKALVLGGARSGKSDLALDLAGSLAGPRYFLATAQALDEEMAARIEAHRKARGEAWETVEEPVEILDALRGLPEGAVVVLDCLTLWLSNLLDSLDWDPKKAEERLAALAEGLASLPLTLVMVSNEVGAGIVPADEKARVFRDLSGRVNRVLARSAHRVVYTVAGLPVVLR